MVSSSSLQYFALLYNKRSQETKQTKNLTKTNKTKIHQTKQLKPSVHTWFSAAKKPPIFTVFRIYTELWVSGFFSAVLRAVGDGEQLLVRQGSSFLVEGEAKSWVLACQTLSEAPGHWIVPQPARTANVTAGSRMGPSTWKIWTPGERGQGRNVHQKGNQKEWEKENF